MVKPDPENASRWLEAVPLDDLTDELLVTAHLEGRPGAFQRLYDRYRDRLIHFITRKTGDSDREAQTVPPPDLFSSFGVGDFNRR